MLLEDTAPGLPFLSHLHRLKSRDLDVPRIAEALLQALRSDLPPEISAPSIPTS
ncbi:hypothetical protein [Mangrovicoccus ximenensis]|uniref:hypothetical protein n=1 Tax=Mangrovicoccus ximenensis TaxID=1911570 RepID=UPI001374A7AB|nr:hypothetical protein [Mangrovicoccus ximenensis]